MRLFSFGESFRRVQRRMVRTAASADCFFEFVISSYSSGLWAREMSLGSGLLKARMRLTGNADFGASCDTLRGLWCDGLLGYGFVWARKPL
jgi:hypothetical protein